MPTIPTPKKMIWEQTPKIRKPYGNRFAYSSNRWSQASIRHRANNPLCVECLKQGRPIPGTCVDHRQPIGTPGIDPWDETNWQTLCKKHHSQKTMRERNG